MSNEQIGKSTVVIAHSLFILKANNQQQQGTNDINGACDYPGQNCLG
jgi:hypothetical protein